MRSLIGAKKSWHRFVYRAVCLVSLSVFLVSAASGTIIRAVPAANSSAAWSRPQATTLKRVGLPDSTQREPNTFSNYDCTAITYHLSDSPAMRTGCFTPTAYGMLDSDSQVVIFNGTDEGVHVLPYSPHELFAPWPDALNLLTVDPAATGGAYINMYEDPVSVMRTVRNALGQVSGKQFTAPPHSPLHALNNQPLIVNPQTLAFSDNGSWLVAETVYGYFVRINLASMEAVPFAGAFNNAVGSSPLNAQVAVSDDGRYVVIGNGSIGSFSVYDLSTCTGNTFSVQTSKCLGHDYWGYLSQQITGLHTIKHLRFVNDNLISFETTSSDPAGPSLYELAPTASIQFPIDYLGLGDSYTSGEGAFNYLPGTDTTDDRCHLSSHSYPLLLSKDIFSLEGGHSVACSGAVINDLSSTADSYKGQVNDAPSVRKLGPDRLNRIISSYEPGYVPQQMFVKQYTPRVLTVSVGGNDIGFGDLLATCVMPHISRHASDETCYNTYEDREEAVQLVDRTVPRWVNLYRQLKAEDPEGQIYAIGYPEIFDDAGKCGLNVNLSKSELEFADELVAYLNASIQKAAGQAGLTYVDISRALYGHRLCEASGNSIAANGLTAGSDSGILGIGMLGRESYHPNALGQLLIEQAILKQTANLKSGEATSSPINLEHNLLGAPVSGRQINAVIHDDTITQQIVRLENPINVAIDGVSDGLQPDSTYSVRLDGSSMPILGNLRSNDAGDVAGSVSVHSTPGEHVLHITGGGQGDDPIDITEPVYIAAYPNDADGDGLTDTDDSCPFALNSGLDNDKDGIDDVCDGMITGSPTPPNTISSSSEAFKTPRDGQPHASDTILRSQPPNLTGVNPPGSSKQTQSFTLVSPVKVLGLSSYYRPASGKKPGPSYLLTSFRLGCGGIFLIALWFVRQRLRRWHQNPPDFTTE